MEELLHSKYKNIIRLFTSNQDLINECYQECYLKVSQKECINNLESYWFLAVRNYFYSIRRTIYIEDVITDIVDDESASDDVKIRMIENDLQRATTKNERYCKFLVQKWIEYGSIRETSKQIGIDRKTIKQAIDDYINNTSIGKSSTGN